MHQFSSESCFAGYWNALLNVFAQTSLNHSRWIFVHRLLFPLFLCKLFSILSLIFIMFRVFFSYFRLSGCSGVGHQSYEELDYLVSLASWPSSLSTKYCLTDVPLLLKVNGLVNFSLLWRDSKTKATLVKDSILLGWLKISEVSSWLEIWQCEGRHSAWGAQSCKSQF